MRLFLDFLTRRQGSIAVEFAFVAPVMVGLFFGLSDLALAENVRGAVVNLASVGADLVSQESSATSADVTNVFSAMSAMLYPYSTANVRITISSIVDNNSSPNGTGDVSGRVAWSCTQGGTARTAGATYTFPATAQGVITSNSGGSVILAEVSYSYSLPVAVTIPGVITLAGPYTMSNVFFSKPRRVLQVPLTSCP